MIAGDGESELRLVERLVDRLGLADACAASRRPRRAERARAVRCSRRGRALLELGELPALRRRGARGRHAGDRHARGGVPEVVPTARTGLLVPVGDAARARRQPSSALLRGRCPARSACAATAAPSVEAYRPERLFAELEQTLVEAARDEAPRPLPRAHALPAAAQRRRCSVASTRSPRCSTGGSSGRPSTGSRCDTDRFTLVRPLPARPARGSAFYAAFPARVVRELRAFRPGRRDRPGSAGHGARRCSRGASPASDVPIVYDVHGDWRNDTRVYGSPLRRALSPLTDRLARPRRTARRRRPHGLGLHDSGSCASRASSRPRPSRPTWTSRRSPPRRRCRFPIAAAGAVRRRARALQGGRRPRRRVAAGRGARPRRPAPPRRPRASARAARRSVSSSPAIGSGALDAGAADRGRRPGARRVDRARAAVARRGHGARHRRGLLSRPRGRRHRLRRHPRPRRGRRQRPARPARRCGRRWPPRCRACSATRSSPTGSARVRTPRRPSLGGDTRGVRPTDARARRPRARAAAPSSMRLVFVTQRVDPDDPVLGATVAKIARARRTRATRSSFSPTAPSPGSLPANCRVRPFASPLARRPWRCASSRRSAAELARRPRPAAVLAHMCPIYAVLAAPLARPLGVRVLLWYAHWNRTRMLEAACARRTSSSRVDRRSVPSPRRRSSGSATASTSPTSPARDAPARGVVRLASRSAATPPRRASTPIVRAVARARAEGLDVRLRCSRHGDAPGRGGEPRRARAPRRRARARRVRSSSAGPLPRRRSRASSRESTALVNNMRPGAPDKVVYEACAACRAGARLEPALRRAARRPRATAPLPARRRRRARGADRDARRARSASARDRIGADAARARAAPVTRSGRGPTRSCGSAPASQPSASA